MLWLNITRRKLAQPTTSLQLGLLGIVAGIASASVIILFRLTIEKLQLQFIDEFDNFTSLEDTYRLLLPLCGALLIAIMAMISRDKHYRMGIPFVIHWVKVRYGAMPFKNALNQFVGGAIALVSGFSVGREGPSVHIGASSASFLGDWLKLPYNCIRILTGCGIAAGISASFNTPLAAVIFVMEVVFREYKIHIFIPIMLAAVIGTLMTRLVFGHEHELSFFTMTGFSDINYLYLILCSVAVSFIAAIFNTSLMKIMRSCKPIKIYYRLLLAAVITGLIGYLVPQALGSGMGAIQFAVNGSSEYGFASALGFVAAILVAKFAATVVALGMGVPGGIIGPIIGLGVLLGALFGLLAQYLGLSGGDIALYSAVCLAGLMAATLHSPLAALVALLELTANPQVIAPAMLVIAVSYTLSVQVFGNKSIFIQQLDYNNLNYRLSPAVTTLQKIGVLAELNTNFQIIENADDDEVSHYLTAAPKNTSLIIRDSYAVGSEYKIAEFIDTHDNHPQVNYWPLQGISSQATMAEAFELIKKQREGAVYVYQDNVENLIGLIHFEYLRQLLIERNSQL